MPENREKQGPVLGVCEYCEQPLPNPMDRIPIVLEKLRKETGFGEKRKSK